MKAINILKAVAKDFKISLPDLQSELSTTKISEAREAYGYLCVENQSKLRENISQCAKLINRKRHVMHYYHRTIKGQAEHSFMLLTKLRLTMMHVQKEVCKPCNNITFNYSTI